MSDVAASAEHPARAIADAWIAQGRASAAATAHARAVADVGPMVAPCDPTPRQPVCGVTSATVPRDPPGMSHRVPPPPVAFVTVLHADLFSDMARCQVALDRMGRRVVSRERPAPRPIAVGPMPVVPELVAGADVAARRGTIDRVAALIRGTVELAALLAAAPPDVAARGRAALAKVAAPPTPK